MHSPFVQKFLSTRGAHVRPRDLSILVAVSHVSLQTRIDVVRDTTCRTGKGGLCGVGNHNVPCCSGWFDGCYCGTAAGLTCRFG